MPDPFGPTDPLRVLEATTTLYGLFAAGAALLQARQMTGRRSSAGVSSGFLAIYTGGYAVWLLYGIAIASPPLILVDAFGLCCAVSTLVIAFKLRPRSTEVQTPVETKGPNKGR